jgi:hypothetical protein
MTPDIPVQTMLVAKVIENADSTHESSCGIIGAPGTALEASQHVPTAATDIDLSII